MAFNTAEEIHRVWIKGAAVMLHADIGNVIEASSPHLQPSLQAFASAADAAGG